MINNNLASEIRTAIERMEQILRRESKSSNKYLRAVRDYQRLLHLLDSTEMSCEPEQV
jgi:hypothetical protein